MLNIIHRIFKGRDNQQPPSRTSRRRHSSCELVRNKHENQQDSNNQREFPPRGENDHDGPTIVSKSKHTSLARFSSKELEDGPLKNSCEKSAAAKNKKWGPNQNFTLTPRKNYRKGFSKGIGTHNEEKFLLFGMDLSDRMQKELPQNTTGVPFFVDLCFKKLHLFAHVEGVFRIPGNILEVDNVISMIHKNSFDPHMFDSISIHTVASLLKRYLRELPEPLIPKNRFREWIELTLTKPISEEDFRHRRQKLLTLYHRLPLYHKILLMRLLELLHDISTPPNVNTSLMTDTNLSFILGMNILKDPEDDGTSVNLDFYRVNSVMLLLIREYEFLREEVEQ